MTEGSHEHAIQLQHVCTYTQVLPKPHGRASARYLVSSILYFFFVYKLLINTQYVKKRNPYEYQICLNFGLLIQAVRYLHLFVWAKEVSMKASDVIKIFCHYYLIS